MAEGRRAQLEPWAIWRAAISPFAISSRRGLRGTQRQHL